jgi:hypothetical protein
MFAKAVSKLQFCLDKLCLSDKLRLSTNFVCPENPEKSPKYTSSKTPGFFYGITTNSNIC